MFRIEVNFGACMCVWHVISCTWKVKELHRLLSPRVDNVTVYVDEWGCKRLTSFCLRRFRTGMFNFRDIWHACVLLWHHVLQFLSAHVSCNAELNIQSSLQDATVQPIMRLMTDKWGGGDDDDDEEDPTDGAPASAVPASAAPADAPAAPTEVAVVPAAPTEVAVVPAATESGPEELSLPALADFYPEEEDDEPNDPAPLHGEDVLPAEPLPDASLPEVIPDSSEAESDCPTAPPVDTEAEQLRQLLKAAIDDKPEQGEVTRAYTIESMDSQADSVTLCELTASETAAGGEPDPTASETAARPEACGEPDPATSETAAHPEACGEPDPATSETAAHPEACGEPDPATSETAARPEAPQKPAMFASEPRPMCPPPAMNEELPTTPSAAASSNGRDPASLQTKMQRLDSLKKHDCTCSHCCLHVLAFVSARHLVN